MWGYVMSFVMIKCFNNIGCRDQLAAAVSSTKRTNSDHTCIDLAPAPAPAGCCLTTTHKLLPALQFKHFYHGDFLFD